MSQSNFYIEYAKCQKAIQIERIRIQDEFLLKVPPVIILPSSRFTIKEKVFRREDNFLMVETIQTNLWTNMVHFWDQRRDDKSRK